MILSSHLSRGFSTGILPWNFLSSILELFINCNLLSLMINERRVSVRLSVKSLLDSLQDGLVSYQSVSFSI